MNTEGGNVVSKDSNVKPNPNNPIAENNLSSSRQTVTAITDDDVLLKFLMKNLTLSDAHQNTTSDIPPCIIDPAVKMSKIMDQFNPDTQHIAIIRRPDFSAALFQIMRHTNGVIIEDPRVHQEPLNLFLNETSGHQTSSEDARVFPRASGSGVSLISPYNSEIINISSYGACIKTTNEYVESPTMKLRLKFIKSGLEADVDCKVAETKKNADHTEIRLLFYKIPTEAQQELMRISISELLSTTISDTFKQFEKKNLDGFISVERPSDKHALIKDAVINGAVLTFAKMHLGRPVRAKAIQIDESSRNYLISMKHPEALGNIGSYHKFSTSINHESYMMDGYVLGNGEKHVVMSFPNICISTDHRSQEREITSSTSPVFVKISGERFAVKNFSGRGFSFQTPKTKIILPLNKQLKATLDFGNKEKSEEIILIRNYREELGMIHWGAIFLDKSQEPDNSKAPPLTEETLLEKNLDIIRVENTYTADRITYLSGEKKIVGLYNESINEGPVTAVIIPPAWAQSKESTSLLSQYLLSTFDSNKKSAAVLRIDYSNAIGESEKSPEFRQLGHDTLGLTFSACVRDIKSGIDYLHERLGDKIKNTVIVGMSFSGPLCLRAAVEDTRVTQLIQYMGASDIQDLVRTSTGGIDYVGRYKSGIRSSVQNVLGMLSDTDRWCRDGINANLALIHDAQIDAVKLKIPLLWIHGMHDAFVNEKRIRSILDVTRTEKFFYKVPYGHIPTKSDDAIQSFMPAVRFLLNETGEKRPIISAPKDPIIMKTSQNEWSKAPRVRLPSLQKFWREYMIGTTEGSLGFDILSMTRGYQEFMKCQIDLIGLEKEQALYDIGGGMGHSLSYLADKTKNNPISVHLFDFVPQLFKIAQSRADKLGISLKTHEWNAENKESYEHFKSAEKILMSLFLSCLRKPLLFLNRLYETVPRGTQIVASSIIPDADISMEYIQLIKDIEKGKISAPDGYTQEQFLQAVRDYMNSAAWLLRLTDEGTFHLFNQKEFVKLFEEAGFKILDLKHSFGTPQRAVVLNAAKK